MKKPTATHIFHLSRLVFVSFLAVALLVARSESSNAFQLTYNKSVLAYASNITINDLLQATNASRAANNLAPLNLSETLDTSAQLKANDMIAKNYWSHTAPDGTQPWYWFNEAGYAYSLAGENLAYGFDTSSEVETAWMGSPTHKANVLGGYEDVGFGIASSADFQGHANTIVVAHYGKKKVVTATTGQTTAPDITGTATVVNGQESGSTVTILSLLQQGKAPIVAVASIGLAAIAAAGFGLTHRAFMKHAIRQGKRFAIHHPVFDLFAIAVTFGVILTTTVGYLL